MVVPRQSLDDRKTIRDVAWKNYDMSIEIPKKLIADREKERIPQKIEQVVEAWREFKSAELLLIVLLESEGRQQDADTHQNELKRHQVDMDKTTATAKRVSIEDQRTRGEKFSLFSSTVAYHLIVENHSNRQRSLETDDRRPSDYEKYGQKDNTANPMIIVIKTLTFYLYAKQGK